MSELFIPKGSKTLDLVLERAKLIEAETLKDASALLTKTGVGIAASIAVVGGMLTSRDTLWWRPFSDNPGAIGLTVIEGLIWLGAVVFFALSYLPMEAEIGPKLEDTKLLNEILLMGEEEEAKATLLVTIQDHFIKNKEKIETRTSFITAGFACLIGLVLLVGVHATWSTSVKTEVERLESLKQSMKGGGVYGGPRSIKFVRTTA